MNKKEILTKKNIEGVANFLKSSVQSLVATDTGCCRFILNDDHAIFVGWSDGYDMTDTDIIKSPTDQRKVGSNVVGYAINAAVKVRNDFYWAEFDDLDFPYYEDNGECWDNALSLKPNMTIKDYKHDAKWFLSTFVSMFNESKKKNTKLRFGR